MILTVTLNLALDVTYVVGDVDWNGMNRVGSAHRRAGGKGVNVARVLTSLGHEVLATGLAGGRTGDAVLADLALAGVTADFTPIAAESRTTLVVSEAGASGSRRNALFNEPGPVVAEDDLARFTRHFAGLLRDADAVVISGSLPPGTPPDFYAGLAAMAAERGVPAIVDADGAPLRHALSGRPAIIKPNADELARAASGEAPPRTASRPRSADADGSANTHGSANTERGADADRSAFADRAQALRSAGAESVVVSLGARGALAVTPGGSWRARMPREITGNPTGAGDALVAGLALGLVEATPWPDRLRRATALGAAAVAAPLAGDVDPDVYLALHPAIGIEPVS
ncbi:1-phosphofructokinase family hexose kinase [Planotetraspora kaengkrachanensis]|uniref:Sugar kinase n=1 Tax=Planotetraspora kaengkrachanensis TaxID=575193 RepID=A0A8J3PXK8_9ACTN|nr:1-phosphofructokinase family hexose kinase [Planotetraspora kaengkrachanensis]GIG82731.1 sugar kinase [Planotetraspora kaengkrachanensis]